MLFLGLACSGPERSPAEPPATAENAPPDAPAAPRTIPKFESSPPATPGNNASATTTPPPTPTAAPARTPEEDTKSPSAEPPRKSLIRLEDPLDEPEFYCVDVVGHRSGVRLDRALQAHTCKPGFDDEIFTYSAPLDGTLHMEAYDLCLEARDGLLYLEPCSDSAGQSFRQREDGTIRPAGGGDCLAVEAGEGQQAGGVSHVRRDLLLTPCESAEPSLSRWVLPGPSP